MPDSLGHLTESSYGFEPPHDGERDDRVLETVESNSVVLQQLLDQVADIRDVLAGQLQVNPLANGTASEDRNGADEQEIESLRLRIVELEDHIYELERQNGDLASQVANETVRNTVGSSATDTEGLSWEQRKELILQQMEEESFDADAFVSSLQNEKAVETVAAATHLRGEGEVLDASALFDQLGQQIDQHEHAIEQRDQEIRELRTLLEQRTTAQQAEDDGYAVGAAAIGQMLDADELIQEERRRLQQLQSDWEEKFREGEIEASLERAKLSRERQELARKQAEVEEQLEHLRREVRQHEGSGGGNSRRWLAKLGLTDNDEP